MNTIGVMMLMGANLKHLHSLHLYNCSQQPFGRIFHWVLLMVRCFVSGCLNLLNFRLGLCWRVVNTGADGFGESDAGSLGCRAHQLGLLDDGDDG